jgi:hypothetical protein
MELPQHHSPGLSTRFVSERTRLEAADAEGNLLVSHNIFCIGEDHVSIAHCTIRVSADDPGMPLAA